jgi:type II secretory ATPase GspE/PulE/Tfp pilus assembly ATPase PilB-like protein
MSVQSEKPPPENTLQSLLEVIREAKDITSIKRILSEQLLEVFQVEMAAIFLLNIRKQELVSWTLLPGDSLKKIVTPIGTNSIIGYVAQKKQPVNIRDPYDFQELRRVGPELNFSGSYDAEANIRSKQILAIPIVHQKTLMGVVELINKRDDTDFTYEEQNKVNELARVLAVAFSTHGIFVKPTPPKYDSLLAQKLLSREELEQGLAKATELHEDPETVLMNNFQIPRLKMGKLLAGFYSTSFVDLEKVDNIPEKLFQGVNIDYFEKEELVPLSLKNGKLIVAVKNIEDQTLAGTIRELFPGVNQVELVFAFQEDIRSFWKRTRARYFSSSNGVRVEKMPSFDTSLFDLLDENKPREKAKEKRVTVVEKMPSFDTSLFDLLDENKSHEKAKEKRVTVVERRVRPEKPVENNDDINEPSVVQLVNKIIEGGYSSQASDIHIEPYGLEENGEVRYRIDGVCRNALKIPQQYVQQVIDRIKSLASLKRGECTRPRDGKIKYTTSEGTEIEMRVATIPTANNNEDIVLRILPAPKPLPLLDELMPSRLLIPFQEIIEQKQGMILVVGPNASGKTTTLHSVLYHINTPEKKIWTAEYPLEIQQHRIRQVQVDPLMNFTFADALRAFHRADPDVIMIGDMQDLQTAFMAVDVALNGHLLLSSLPASSAAEGIIHCLNMGLDPLHLAATLLGVLAQRLVRTLCEHCKEPYHPEKTEYDRLLESYGVSFFEHINVMYSDDLVFHRANGCPRCNDSGYHGRTGLYELLVVNQSIRKLIMKRASLGEIIEEAMINDMTLLLQEGIQLIFKGTIDYKELMSVCPL